ncbi:MAG: hypothetical protein A2505_01240 [Deltaproteobacteria bacterium RIFOXYD12_FULL_55_16]|nr:MAG: hypothetical protein A2505_01240 [Deltaproteobacteria bacterium RIFOXYD12_FULL_55_16]
MKKETGMIFAVMLVLVFAGVAFACGNGPGVGCGQGGGYYNGANAETMKKFQQESLSLRDELMIKQIELQTEFSKPVLDRARIASIRKEVIDIQAKVQVVADKHGIPAFASGAGGGMMAGRGGRGMMAGAAGACPQCQSAN